WHGRAAMWGRSNQTVRYLADLLNRSGRGTDAETLYRTAIDRMGQMDKRFPETPEYRQEIGRLQSSLGLLLDHNGRLSEAEQNLRDAIGNFQALAPVVNADQDRWRRQELMWAHQFLAALFERSGRPNESASELRAAIAEAQHLQASFP